MAAVGEYKLKKRSPHKWGPMMTLAAIQAGVAVVGYMSGRKRRRREEREAREALERSRKQYLSQDLSNPYANMENTYEDLTVNQQQAHFQASQARQQQADILGGLRGTAGGAGVAGLAQALSNQGALTTQRIAASIGQQESMNQRLRAQGAAAVQAKERYGDALSTQWETERRSTLFGMDMQRMAAAKQAKAAAKQRLISGLGSALGTAAVGISGGETFGKQSTPTVPRQYNLGMGGLGGQSSSGMVNIGGINVPRIGGIGTVDTSQYRPLNWGSMSEFERSMWQAQNTQSATIPEYKAPTIWQMYNPKG